MRPRQPLPRLWLMTDERQGEDLWEALERLPRGSGVVFRHHSLARKERRERWLKVRRVARRYRLVPVTAGERMPGFAGVHNGPGRGIRTRSAHNLRELRAAEREDADLVFLSPVFATRSHPGAKPLGVVRFMLIARQARTSVIALGGMSARRFRRLKHSYGWAAIDAWSTDSD